jgi:hypothetical protein
MGSMLFAGVVWTFWIAVPLAIGAILAVIFTIFGYLKNVTQQRYPKSR